MALDATLGTENNFVVMITFLQAVFVINRFNFNIFSHVAL